MEELAHTARISRPGLYFLFESKETLSGPRSPGRSNRTSARPSHSSPPRTGRCASA
ncbi:hypothetical protein ACIQUM_38525 [Amycolatopsis azurea]|uniref:hypothetical protein n=1 Tax=Amycolatopsis azurea TaxID=36819 RepID=UPI003805969A